MIGTTNFSKSHEPYFFFGGGGGGGEERRKKREMEDFLDEVIKN